MDNQTASSTGASATGLGATRRSPSHLKTSLVYNRFDLKENDMKQGMIRFLCLLLLIALVAVACKNDEKTPHGPKKNKETIEKQEQVDLLDEAAMLPLADYRILLASDTHYTYLSKWYDVTPEARMQYFVDAVLYEHAQRPFDLIVILGDLSLDHWEWNGGGSYIKDGVSTSAQFMEKYVSQLPKDVPVFVLAGNHEQFGNEKWKEITGNDRQGSMVLGDNLFLFLDSYAQELDPDFHHDGVSTPPDVHFIREEMEKYPEHNVYMISHYFDLSAGGTEFQKLVSDPRVVALFQGHTHQCTVKELGKNYGKKQLLQTGNFSYTAHDDSTAAIKESFWGFRDLVIVGERAVSRYIVAKSRAKIFGTVMDVKRQLTNVATLKLPY